MKKPNAIGHSHRTLFEEAPSTHPNNRNKSKGHDENNSRPGATDANSYEKPPEHRQDAGSEGEESISDSSQDADYYAAERETPYTDQINDISKDRTTQPSGSASSWEGQFTQSSNGNILPEPTLPTTPNQTNPQQCPICK